MFSPMIMQIITSFISAVVGAIVGAVVSKIKTVNKNAEENRRIANESKETQRQTLLLTCRMAIYDEHFSVNEKLDAYHVYRDHGGNHQTKKYMDDLIGGDVDDYLEKHKI